MSQSRVSHSQDSFLQSNIQPSHRTGSLTYPKTPNKFITSKDMHTNSHYFGFGNIAIDRLSMYRNNHSRTTGYQSSGKFREKLLFKQSQLEEQMMKNRIKKLQAKDLELTRQIQIADQKSLFAEEVAKKRQLDQANKIRRLNQIEQERQRQQQKNAIRKTENEKIKDISKRHILERNAYSRHEQKRSQCLHKELIQTFRVQEIEAKRERALSIYNFRNQMVSKMTDERNEYLNSVQETHNQTAQEICQQTKEEQEKLKELEEEEQRCIQNLQKTLEKKAVADRNLKLRSPSLKKAVQPRMAHRYTFRQQQQQ